MAHGEHVGSRVRIKCVGGGCYTGIVQSLETTSGRITLEKGKTKINAQLKKMLLLKCL